MYRYKYISYITIILMLNNCIVQNYKKKDVHILFSSNQKKQIHPDSLYDNYIYFYAKSYGVDMYLIKAIIKVESNYNPTVVSKSNAVGLMQIKADTAGKDAYRLKGWEGKPSIHDLKNAVINIELGTAYLSILQKQLKGIINMETRRYAIIVAYVNGLGALLDTFSPNRVQSIEKINMLKPKQFCQYIKHHHPSIQAQRYLYKVNAAYFLHN